MTRCRSLRPYRAAAAPRDPRRLRLEALEDRATPSATLVKDLGTSTISGGPMFTAVGSTMYFGVDYGGSNPQLWRTNGTEAGTVQVDHGTTAEEQSHRVFLNDGDHPAFVGAGQYLYFLTDDDGAGTTSLWRNDSQTGVSEKLRTLDGGPEHLAPWNLTAIGQDVYFAAYAPATDTPDHTDWGYELWKVDGATGATAPFRDTWVGPDSGYPAYLTGVGPYLYYDAATNPQTGAIYRADLPAPVMTGPRIDNTRVVGTDLYVLQNYGVDSTDAGVWVIHSSPSASNIELVKSITSWSFSYSGFYRDPFTWAAAGDTLYFTDADATGEFYQVWKVQGSTATPLSAVIQGPTGPTRFLPLQITANESQVFVTDVQRGNHATSRIWSIDKATGTTSLLHTFDTPGLAPYEITWPTAVGSRIYFGAGNLDRYQLWQTSGSPDTLQPVDASGPDLRFNGWGDDVAYDGLKLEFLRGHYPPYGALGASLYFSTGTQLWRVVDDPYGTPALQDALDSEPPVDPATGHPTVTLTATTDAQAATFLAIFDPTASAYTPLVPPAGATSATPVDIVVTIPATYGLTDFHPTIPAGIRLQINGGMWYGGSPALTLDAGDLAVTHATFVNNTPAPTILVTGGRLTLRDCTIQESTGATEPAIQVTGGIIDLGTAADPGGNTLNVNGAGTLLRNDTTATVTAFGNHWTADGAAVAPGPRVAGPVVWGASPTLTVTGGSFVYDGQPHPVSATVTGAGGALLGTPAVTYAYRDGDGNWVPTANGGTAAPLEPGYYRATAVFGGTDIYQPATAAADITIAYAVRSLTDLGAAFRAGRTIPIKLQLLDANGINVSSAGIDVTALRLERLNADGTRTEVALQDAGGSNPGDLFRYDAALGGYIFNLSTRGLTAGTYDFVWAAGDDPTEHTFRFSLI
jgi:ELWxxDGT repeat protein